VKDNPTGEVCDIAAFLVLSTKGPIPPEELELTTEKLVKKYYSAWIEAFNEKLTNTSPKHRPYDCAQ